MMTIVGLNGLKQADADMDFAALDQGERGWADSFN